MLAGTGMGSKMDGRGRRRSETREKNKWIEMKNEEGPNRNENKDGKR